MTTAPAEVQVGSQPQGPPHRLDVSEFYKDLKKKMRRQVWIAFGCYGVFDVLLWLWSKHSD